MNSIYKCLNGQHIDLSKIVTLHKVKINFLEGVNIYFQLMDKPVFVDIMSLITNHHFGAEDKPLDFLTLQENLYQDILLAWKKFKREVDPESV